MAARAAIGLPYVQQLFAYPLPAADAASSHAPGATTSASANSTPFLAVLLTGLVATPPPPRDTRRHALFCSTLTLLLNSTHDCRVACDSIATPPLLQKLVALLLPQLAALAAALDAHRWPHEGAAAYASGALCLLVNLVERCPQTAERLVAPGGGDALQATPGDDGGATPCGGTSQSGAPCWLACESSQQSYSSSSQHASQGAGLSVMRVQRASLLQLLLRTAASAGRFRPASAESAEGDACAFAPTQPQPCGTHPLAGAQVSCSMASASPRRSSKPQPGALPTHAAQEPVWLSGPPLGAEDASGPASLDNQAAQTHSCRMMDAAVSGDENACPEAAGRHCAAPASGAVAAQAVVQRVRTVVLVLLGCLCMHSRAAERGVGSKLELLGLKTEVRAAARAQAAEDGRPSDVHGALLAWASTTSRVRGVAAAVRREEPEWLQGGGGGNEGGRRSPMVAGCDAPPSVQSPRGSEVAIAGGTACGGDVDCAVRASDALHAAREGAGEQLHSGSLVLARGDETGLWRRRPESLKTVRDCCAMDASELCFAGMDVACL